MVLKTLLLAYLLHLLPYTHGWSIVPSRPVVLEPEARQMSFEDIYSQHDTFRLNDAEMGLTALKDKKLVSCFVNDYDPYWLPGPSEKIYIIRNQPCDKVNKNTDFTTLKKKAGSKIANMCRDLYVFWLAAHNMGMFQSRDCPYDDDLLVPLTTMELAPPMLPEGARLILRIGTPPMLDDGAPPMSREGAPPMSRDEEPPMIDDGAPPMLQSGVQPMLNDGEMRPPLIEKSHSRRDLDAPPSLAAVLKKMMKKNKETDIVAPPAPDMKTPPPPNQFRRNISRYFFKFYKQYYM